MRLLELILRLFREQPLLAVVAALWVFGVIASALRKKKQSTGEPDADEAETEPSSSRGSSPSTTMTERSAEEVAREMRRILGVEPAEPPPVEPPAPPPLPVRRREVAMPEREPTPVVPTTPLRRLPVHVDPHVGEGIQRRAAPDSGRVGAHPGHELGSLGGRTAAHTRRGVRGHRYELDDLKRILVLNEILGPPLALRAERRD